MACYCSREADCSVFASIFDERSTEGDVAKDPSPPCRVSREVEGWWRQIL